MRTVSRSLRRWALAALLLALVGGSLWWRSRGARFDAALWRDPRRAYSEEDPVRLRMVDDLLRRHPLRGMTRAQVVALLGEPRPTRYFREYDLVYWLGPERGWLSMDSEWLVVRLDSRGRVAEYRVVRD